MQRNRILTEISFCLFLIYRTKCNNTGIKITNIRTAYITVYWRQFVFIVRLFNHKLYLLQFKFTKGHQFFFCYQQLPLLTARLPLFQFFKFQSPIFASPLQSKGRCKQEKIAIAAGVLLIFIYNYRHKTDNQNRIE